MQVMHPGEVASSHAHSASALRFIMEGEGAYTVVDGHKMTLGRNDFVLTPNGTWHEHGVSSDGTPCIWSCSCSIAADAWRSSSWSSIASVVINGAVGGVGSASAPCWAARSPNEGAVVVADLGASAEI